MDFFQGAVEKSLRWFGRSLVRHDALESLHQELDSARALTQKVDFLLSMPVEQRAEQLATLRRYFGKSRAQFLQDLFVLCVTNFKRGGFFVEFGATNGIDINNTYLLETDFSWGGILAEPARIWHEPLRRNRRAAIDTRCVWSKSDEVVEFTQDGGDPERSGITSLTTAGTDGDRGSPQRYPVQTVSLNDLLSGHGSPTHVDYLSLDTEGSEHQILEAFDFCRYTVDIITVEHNHTPQRQLLHDLLQRRGFGRVYEHLSAVDDWYIRRDASFADLIPTTSLM